LSLKPKIATPTAIKRYSVILFKNSIYCPFEVVGIASFPYIPPLYPCDDHLYFFAKVL
jgi:hypothetical protein